MKRFNNTKIFLAVMLSFWATGRVVFGQTNTFPDTGKAGIGTTSPFLPLHIQETQGGALLPLLLLRNSSGIPSSAVSLDFTNFAGTQTSNEIGARIQALRTSTDPKHALVFSTSGAGWALSEKMRLTDTGNLGIGTSSPQGKLDVSNGFFTNPGSIVLRAEGGTNEGGQLRFNGAGTNRYFYLDNYAGSLRFISQDDSVNESEKIRILNNGSVGIGTTNPNSNYKLSVNGKIRAKEVVVETNWSDFVFADNYKLMPLDELEKSIKQNRHLPGLPSEKEVAENGVSLGEMQSKLLQKIEELTLYVLELKKENARLHERVDILEKKQQ